VSHVVDFSGPSRYVTTTFNGPTGQGGAGYLYQFYYWAPGWTLEHSINNNSRSAGYTLQRNGYHYKIQSHYWNGGAWILNAESAGRCDSTAPTISSVSTGTRFRGGYRYIQYTYSDDHTGVGTVKVDVSLPGSSSYTLNYYDYIPSDTGSDYLLLQFLTAGTHNVLVQGADQKYVVDSNITSLPAWNVVQPNWSSQYSASFYVDPIPSTGPTVSAPYIGAVELTRTDATCDASRWEFLITGQGMVYLEVPDSASTVYDFSDSFTGLRRNRIITYKGYQLNWTGTSPSTDVTTHSAMSPYRSHNMLKRQHAPIEKRAAWLDGV
jgi:hypothetical protein